MSHYVHFQNLLSICISEGFGSFEQCPRSDQEDMAKHYWLSLDKQERMKFMEHMEETLQEVAYGNGSFTQADIEEALIEFYGPEIDN